MSSESALPAIANNSFAAAETSSITSSSSENNEIDESLKVANTSSSGDDNDSNNRNNDDNGDNEEDDAEFDDKEECILAQGRICICHSCEQERRKLETKKAKILARKRKLGKRVSGGDESNNSDIGKSKNKKADKDDDVGLEVDFVVVNSEDASPGGQKRLRGTNRTLQTSSTQALSSQVCQPVSTAIITTDKAIEKQSSEAIKLQRMTSACHTILECIGEDPNREGLLKTPSRWAKALLFMTSGYRISAEQVLNDAVFTEDSHKEIVVVKDIDIHSMCEHHMVPFTGRVHVGYIPNGKIIGLSKIARIAEVFSRRLQVQERLTRQIVDAIVKAVQPLGVGVVVECTHFCMVMRGVQKVGAKTVTSCVRGCFESNPKTRAEFFNIINGNGR